MDAHSTVSEHGPDDVRQGYDKMLRGLRQDLGCTREKLIKYPRLIRALEYRVAAEGAVSIAACIAALKDLIDELGNPKHRDALLVALRLDPRFQEVTVTARRESYNKYLMSSGDPVDRGLRVDSIRTLERRENEGIKVINSYLNGGFVGSETSVNPPSVSTSPAEMVGITTVSAAFTYYFSEQGVVVREDVNRWVKAVIPNAGTRVSWSHEYYAENRRGVLKCYADFGCRLVDSAEVDNGSVLATWELPRSLRLKDDPYSMGYHVIVDSTRRCDSIISWRSGSDTKRVEFRLVFHPAMAPLRAWWFTDNHAVRPRIEPGLHEGRHIDVLDTGETIYVLKIFESERLFSETLYGVCWVWND